MNRKLLSIGIALTVLVVGNGCKDVLEPQPIDQLVNDVVLNEPKDIASVEIGMYQAFRSAMPTVVVAGDLTADNLIHIGTFAQYRELGVKKITSANASVSALWGSLYRTIYIANFMLERVPEISSASSSVRDKAIATAHFLRGLSYFTLVTTYGGVPKVVTTSIDDNRNIARTSAEEMLDFVEEEYKAALGVLDAAGTTPAFASENAVRAALARYYLYRKNYAQAEAYASLVINSGEYELESDFAQVVLSDFPSESIFEVGYTIADDNEGTNLNTLLLGRREMIPSNEEIVALASAESGDRFASIEFNVDNLKGNDNGWSVSKYGTAVDDNNNIYVFRLAEMYLIRAEARAVQGNVSGANSAQSDINVLRTRAKAPTIGSVSQTQMIQLIENERRYELAFEGHRWYDLVRTGRASVVMPVFNSNWKSAYELWPLPQRELQNNSLLAGDQNPGY